MTKRIAFAALLLLIPCADAQGGEVKVTLRGSRASMLRQNRIARAQDYSFLRTSRDVRAFANAGRLVPVAGGDDYRVLADWPYTRPVVRDFVELLAARYRAACDEPLVVTSLTRPARSQPRNASPLSVHPAGMAVDLRVSSRRSCVRWLEEELLALEDEGLVDATREYRPPHFHVAVFPGSFEAHLAARAADSLRAAARVDSIRAAEHERLLASLPAIPVLTAPDELPFAPLLGWLYLVGRMLLRV